MSRLKNLAHEDMTAAQRRVRDDILAGPRGRVGGPMNAWFRSPELAGLSQKLGAFCRFGTSLEPRLSELAILIVARHWTAQVEWATHQPVAVRAGISEDVTEAIKEHRRPAFDRRDERVLYEFCTQLMEQKSVNGPTYAMALETFGERGLVELVAVVGYYTYVAMTLNSFQVPVQDGEPPL